MKRCTMCTMNAEVSDSALQHICLRDVIEGMPRVPSTSSISEATTTVESETSTSSFDVRRRTQCTSVASNAERVVNRNVEQEDMLRKRSDTSKVESKHTCVSWSPPRHIVDRWTTAEDDCGHNHCRSTPGRLAEEESEELHTKNRLLRSFLYSTLSTSGVGWRSTSSMLNECAGNDQACHERALFTSILS